MNLEEIWRRIQKNEPIQVKEEYLAVLSYMLEKQIKSVIEVGSHKGGTALGFLMIGCSVTTIDILKQKEIKTLERHFAKKYLYLDRSAYPGKLKPKSVDMLFIDADHSYEAVKKDYEEFVPFVKENGYVLFHDTLDCPAATEAGFGVYKFWNEVKGENYKEFLLGTWGGLSIKQL